MSKRIFIGFLLGMLTGVAAAQNAERALRDAVVKQQRYLRGFSADATVRGHWDGSALVMDPPQIRTLGVFVTKSVKVKGDKVVIQGNRQTLLRNSETHLVLSALPEQVTIEISLNGADKALVMPHLTDSLFYKDLAQAVSDLPQKYKKALPLRVDKAQRPKPDIKLCDCADPTPNSCSEDGPIGGEKGMVPPKVIHSVDPEFSEEAHQAKFNGGVQFGLEVGTNGLPKNIWITKPAGLGLDAKAYEAVRQYIFTPATCHGAAVPVSLYIDVNFLIF